jgi:hypothetical protein
VLAFAGNAEPHDDITVIATRPVARSPLGLEEVSAEADAERLHEAMELGR